MAMLQPLVLGQMCICKVLLSAHITNVLRLTKHGTYKQLNKQVRQQDAYPPYGGGGEGQLKLMCNTATPFSKATFPSLIVCLYLLYSRGEK